MRKMKVCNFGISLEKKELITLSVNLPKNSEILSVKTDNGDHVMWLYYMAPSEECLKQDHELWCEFEFIIVDCKYGDIEIDEHKFINIICIEDTDYAVFCKKITK